MAWYYIKPNHSVASPRYIITLDTETVKEQIDGKPLEFNNYLRCGCAISLRLTDRGVTARKMLHFEESAVFWDWLAERLPKKATTWIVAHKASFDWSVIGGWNALGNGTFSLCMPRGKRPVVDECEQDERKQRGLCVIEDPPFILGLRHKSGSKVIVVDTLNWFRCTLAQLGEDIGIKKLEMPPHDAPIENWKMYCQRDTEIVEAAFVSLVDFVRENDYGMFRYTAPSQALSAFRHKHMKHKIAKHDNMPAKKLERDGYYGGETRLFYQGEVDSQVYQLDVNGLFPFVMREHKFPCYLLDYEECDMDSTSCMIEYGGNSIADVTIKSDFDTYPIRDKLSMAYCRGEFRTTLAGIELQRAQSTGCIKTYHRYAKYDCAMLFRDYVNDLYAKRQYYKRKENKAYDLLCKLLLNSLYGKFGQRSFRWQQRFDVTPAHDWCKWCRMDWESRVLELWRSIAGYVFYSPAPGEHTDSFPAIPAFVCAAARDYMRQLREIAGPNNVYYQATDSLFTNATGQLNLLQAGLLSCGDLGRLRIVAIADNAEFIGPNNYRIGNVSIRAGLGRTARKVDNKHWLTEHFEHADGAVSRQPTDCVHSWQSIFAERSPTIRGIKSKDGWVQPLTLTLPLDPTTCGESSGSANSRAI